MHFSKLARAAVASTLLSLLATQPAWAWGRDGHMMINRLAAQYLPSDVPAFLRNGNALDTMEYLGPEPDRWHNKSEQELRDQESPDHFIDGEYAAMVFPLPSLPRERRDFIAAAEKFTAAHPELKLTPGRIGFQPWAVEEQWQRLKVDMREYRKLLAAHADTAPVQLAILYDAGILGHYVADGAQPLHTTLQFNGWTGPNPNGYTTEHKIHAQFESTYVGLNIRRDADVASRVAASTPQPIADEWTQYLAYLQHTSTFVEKTYQLEKSGAFTGPGTPEGKAFTTERLAAGAIELRDLIYSAWTHSADPIEEYKGPQ
jgi:hypothetical protein